MRRDSRLYRAAAKLPADAIEALTALIDGRGALLGRMVIERTALGWLVRLMDEDAEGPHTVIDDLSACSCQDNRFRRRECKHMKALRKFLRGQAQPWIGG
jgi:hypothetical protein